MPSFIDTPGAHTINGSNIDDFIQGNDGADTLNGRDGNDTIYGGTALGVIDLSNDIIDGGDGNERGDQAILDGSRAALVIEEAIDERLHGGCPLVIRNAGNPRTDSLMTT